MKILFITAHRIGDAVLSTGLLRHLTDAYPGAEITVACGPLGADLFKAVPGLAAIIPMPKQSYNRHWLDLWRRCIGQHWDMIVDLRDSLASCLLHRNRRYAYRPRPGLHKARVNAAIMGLTPPPAPKIWIDAAAEREAGALTAGAAPILALAPAANWPAKQWPPEHFAALIEALLAAPDWRGSRIMVLAAAHEREQILPVLQAVPAGRAIELIGAPLLLAAACLCRANILIGNDSGLMHLAAAVETPTLGLFGPGDAEIYGPWGAHTAIVRTPETAAELLARMPAAGMPVPSLMGSLTVATVAGATLGLLASGKRDDLHRAASSSFDDQL